MTTNDVIVFNGKKWTKGTRTFKSSVTHAGDRGAQLYLPKPISDMWGTPDSVIFQMQGDSVTLRKGKLK
jgi:hypothetical protein